jgi:hypothetical protein
MLKQKIQRMIIAAKLEERWLRAQQVSARSAGSPLAPASRHAASSSVYAVARSKDYRAARIARRVRAVLSIACWHAS